MKPAVRCNGLENTNLVVEQAKLGVQVVVGVLDVRHQQLELLIEAPNRDVLV